jgi:HSP20 family protein
MKIRNAMQDRPTSSVFFSTSAQAAPATTWRPPADVYRTRDGWLLKFDLAGVRLEDVTVQASGSAVTVSGVRRDWMIEEGCCHYSMEISYSRFERTIHLPCDIETARVTVDYRNGILLVRATTEGEKK